MKKNAQKQQQQQQQQKNRKKRTRENRSYSERVRAKWFCCAFNLGFLQLICKASLIFKSNLLLALSIILKQRHFNKASYKDALPICKRFLCSTINRRNKELQDLSKELSLSKNVLSKQLSTTDIYILTKSITLHNKKSLQKLLNTQQKKLSSLTRNCILPHS